jgi:hypothetical protein
VLAADRPAPTPDVIRKLAAATVAAAADSVAATAGVLSLPTAGASAEFRVTGRGLHSSTFQLNLSRF